MPHDVLISYSRHDKLQADAICNRLESQGIRCWIAPRDVPVGSEWADSIVEAIQAAHVLVLVYSRSADASDQVRREVERAVSEGKQIMPVRLEDVAMSKSFEYYVGSIHWLDAMTPPLEEHIDKLARNLKQALGTPPPEPAPAPEEASGAASGGGRAPAPDPVPGAAPTPASGRPPSPARPARSRMPKAAALRAAAFGVPVALGGWFLFMRGPVDQVILDVSGTDEAAATERLADQGFDVAVELVESDRAAGEAVGTDPGAGSEAAVGSVVTLRVSGMVTLPDLTGRTESAAVDEVSALRVGAHVFPRDAIEVTLTDSGEEGLVQATDPGPGSRILLGTPVTLLVAGEEVGVPGVAGLPWEAAAERLTEAELAPRRIEDWHASAARGTALWTDPAPGTRLGRGSEVRVGVAGVGGWSYLNRRDLEVGDTLSMPGDLRIRAEPTNEAAPLGSIPRGAWVRVLDEPTVYGWVKVVRVQR